jgi:flagella basal body P-ring formation protein FlgA
VRQEVDGASTLEAVVREYITARIPDRDAKIEIQFNPASRAALQLPAGGHRLELKPRRDDRLGLISLEAEMTDSNGARRSIPVVAEVWLVKEVVVSRGTINRGKTVSSRDLKLEERRFKCVDDVGITDLAAVVGQQSRRFIKADEMLQPDWIKPKPLVRRGDHVTVWLRRGEVVLKTSGKAQQAGSLGDRIEVRRDGARRRQELIEAVVTGPGTVTMSQPRQLASR